MNTLNIFKLLNTNSSHNSKKHYFTQENKNSSNLSNLSNAETFNYMAHTINKTHKLISVNYSLCNSFKMLLKIFIFVLILTILKILL